MKRKIAEATQTTERQPPAAAKSTPMIEALRDTPDGKAHLQTVADVVRNVRARAAEQVERETIRPTPETIRPTPETIRPTPETTAAPRETPAPAEASSAVRISDPDRRRLLLRALGAALVHVLEDGEELTVSALRVGSCVVIEGLDVSGAA